MRVGTKKVFRPRDDRDVVALVDAWPLAWVVCGKPADFAATPLPLQIRCDTQGRPVRLVGHFARSNPQVEQLRQDPEALVLLLGPQGYISPSWFDDRSMAPTWTYTSAAFRVRIVLEDDPVTIRQRIEELVTAVEAHHPQPWRIEDMGERFASLAQHVVGFHADILEMRASFKLGQDEREDVFADILAGLDATGQHELVTWMEAQAGPERLARVAAARKNSKAASRIAGQATVAAKRAAGSESPD